MVAVERLETFAEINDSGDPRQMSATVRHEAVLTDGRRVLLLNDRGWTSKLHSDPPDADVDVWASTSTQDIVETSRMVVGPDEAFEGHSQAEMDTDHWASMMDILEREGVVVTERELRRLPHDVVLSVQIRARLRS